MGFFLSGIMGLLKKFSTYFRICVCMLCCYNVFSSELNVFGVKSVEYEGMRILEIFIPIVNETEDTTEFSGYTIAGSTEVYREILSGIFEQGTDFQRKITIAAGIYSRSRPEMSAVNEFFETNTHLEDSFDQQSKDIIQMNKSILEEKRLINLLNKYVNVMEIITNTLREESKQFSLTKIVSYCRQNFENSDFKNNCFCDLSDSLRANFDTLDFERKRNFLNSIFNIMSEEEMYFIEYVLKPRIKDCPKFITCDFDEISANVQAEIREILTEEDLTTLRQIIHEKDPLGITKLLGKDIVFEDPSKTEEVLRLLYVAEKRYMTKSQINSQFGATI